jgi:hypothetical protein
MWKKAVIILSAITLTLPSGISFGQQASKSQITVFCDLKSEPLTTLMKLPEEENPKIFFSWYSEYLNPEDSAEELCQQVIAKLQAKFNMGKIPLLAAQELKEKWAVCLIDDPEDNCSSYKAEILFYLNRNYVKTPECLINNTRPSDCQIANERRGLLLSIPPERYTPPWWPF